MDASNCALGKDQCSWYGFHNEHLDHFKQNHEDFILNSKQNKQLLIELEFTDLNAKFSLQILQKINEIYETGYMAFSQTFCNNGIIQLRILHIDIQEEKKDEENDTSNIEKPLECPVCLEHFLPPIYLCETGHSICESCDNQLKQCCPLCKKTIGDTRNFALEDIVLNKLASCKNSNCTFTGKGADIQKHQEWCDNRSVSCFFSDQSDKKIVCRNSVKVCEMYNHVVSQHNTSLLKFDEENRSFIITELHSIYVLKYMCKLFRLLIFRHQELDTICWSLQLTGNTEYCKQFKFAVNINIGKNYSICLEGPCIPIQPSSKYFENPKNFIISDYKDISYPYSVTILDFVGNA